ncbi:MAG: threonine ammonia-lyase, partial [Rhodospirillaceae bacterium]|nr:threonine ammonia-lyase [Rhodospirillaceae bacterium]
MTVTIEDIRAAAATIGDQVVRTPCVPSRTLSAITGAEIWLKFENLQYTASFKDRGALNKLASLTEEEKSRGVIACSAGNHAQGVAYHAERLGIPATIVMPAATPFTKVRLTRAFGAEVVLTGDDLSTAQAVAEEIRAREGYTFIHPYDDDRIIAGQGTVGLEMLEDAPELDCLVVPIGGGGLIAGIAVAAKSLKPEIEIIGVEAALYPSMAQAIRGEAPTSGGQTIAEGIAVKRPGERTRTIIERHVSEILMADESALEQAVLLLMEIEKTVAEGAGAAALAAVRANPERFRGRKTGLVVSGGNIDRRILASILMRGLVRDGRITRIRATITDAPGTLAKVTRIVGEVGGNIVEVLHQRMFYDVPVKQAELDIVVETRDSDHAEEIMTALRQAGYPTREL